MFLSKCSVPPSGRNYVKRYLAAENAALKCYIQFRLQAVSRAAAQIKPERSVLYYIGTVIPEEAQLILVQSKADAAAFPGLQGDLLKCLQFFDRAHDGGRHIPHVQLYRFHAGPFAIVLHFGADFHGILRLDCAEVLIAKARITEAVAEGIQRFPSRIQIAGREL